jgi:putative lipoic acid-binding regulatory protein
MSGKDGGNGNGRMCNLFGRETVNYPVRFDLKAIVKASIKKQESINNIEYLLNKHKVPFENWRSKPSSGGKYISFTVNVEIRSQQILEKLYADLKKVPGLKFAL